MYSYNNFTSIEFTGRIFISDMQGELISAFELEDGYSVSKYQINATDSAARSLASRDDCDCLEGWECSWCQLDEVVITTKKKTIKLGDLYTSVVPNEEDFNESLDAVEQVGGGGGILNTNTCGAGQVKNDDGNCVDVEDKLIYDPSLPSCVKNIIEELVNDNYLLDLNDLPDFILEELNLSGFVLNLFDNSDDYHLNFSMASQVTNTNGEVVNSLTNTTRRFPDIIQFNILLNSDYIENGTDLAITRTIIHETLHAYISYWMQENATTSLAQSLQALASRQGMNQSQHNHMINTFLNGMSNSLENWHTNQLSNQGGQLSTKTYYDYLVWSGDMRNTTAFSQTDPAFQKNVEDANIAEGDAVNAATNKAQGSKLTNCN